MGTPLLPCSSIDWTAVFSNGPGPSYGTVPGSSPGPGFGPGPGPGLSTSLVPGPAYYSM